MQYRCFKTSIKSAYYLDGCLGEGGMNITFLYGTGKPKVLMIKESCCQYRSIYCIRNKISGSIHII